MKENLGLAVIVADCLTGKSQQISLLNAPKPLGFRRKISVKETHQVFEVFSIIRENGYDEDGYYVKIDEDAPKFTFKEYLKDNISREFILKLPQIEEVKLQSIQKTRNMFNALLKFNIYPN